MCPPNYPAPLICIAYRNSDYYLARWMDYCIIIWATSQITLQEFTNYRKWPSELFTRYVSWTPSKPPFQESVLLQIHEKSQAQNMKHNVQGYTRTSTNISTRYVSHVQLRIQNYSKRTPEPNSNLCVTRAFQTLAPPCISSFHSTSQKLVHSKYSKPWHINYMHQPFYIFILLLW